MRGLLTTTELADALNVSTRHLFRLKKDLPYVKVGKSLRWELDRVIAALRMPSEKE